MQTLYLVMSTVFAFCNILAVSESWFSAGLNAFYLRMLLYTLITCWELFLYVISSILWALGLSGTSSTTSEQEEVQCGQNCIQRAPNGCYKAVVTYTTELNGQRCRTYHSLHRSCLSSWEAGQVLEAFDVLRHTNPDGSCVTKRVLVAMDRLVAVLRSLYCGDIFERPPLKSSELWEQLHASLAPAAARAAANNAAAVDNTHIQCLLSKTGLVNRLLALYDADCGSASIFLGIPQSVAVRWCDNFQKDYLAEAVEVPDADADGDEDVVPLLIDAPGLAIGHGSAELPSQGPAADSSQLLEDSQMAAVAGGGQVADLGAGDAVTASGNTNPVLGQHYTGLGFLQMVRDHKAAAAGQVGEMSAAQSGKTNTAVLGQTYLVLLHHLQKPRSCAGPGFLQMVKEHQAAVAAGQVMEMGAADDGNPAVRGQRYTGPGFFKMVKEHQEVASAQSSAASQAAQGIRLAAPAGTPTPPKSSSQSGGLMRPSSSQDPAERLVSSSPQPQPLQQHTPLVAPQAQCGTSASSTQQPSASGAGRQQLACHMMCGRETYAGVSLLVEVTGTLGEGAYSQVSDAVYRGLHTVNDQGNTLFAHQASRTERRRVLRKVKKQLKEGQKIALKVGHDFAALPSQQQQQQSPAAWREKVRESFYTEARCYQRTAGSRYVLNLYGVARIEELSAAGTAAAGAAGDGSQGSSSSWPLALLLERGECSLQDRLDELKAQGRCMDAWQVHKVTVELVQMLDFLHRMGIVWRDLKPANIQIVRTPSGYMLKACDFGLAWIMGYCADFASSAVGTPGYMAPEVRGEGAYGPQADLHSLGYSLLQCRVGERPGSYMRYDPAVSPEECAQRLGNWEAELSHPGCPYANQLKPAELHFLQGLLAYNPAYRWHLAELLSKYPRAVYMRQGPDGVVVD